MIALHLILFAAALYLGFAVLYQLFYALAGLLAAPQPVARDEHLRSFAVFIVAAKEDAAIVQTTKRALRQRYPHERFEVLVLANQLRTETLQQLRRLPIRVVEVGFGESTKISILQAGINALSGKTFEGAVVLQADTVMAPDFLLEANRYMAAGFRVVQGQRTAPPHLSTETRHWAAISEAIENHILCAGHHALGLSARLAGSGMVFDYELFVQTMHELDTNDGLELELRLIQAGESIAYAESAVIYDEKLLQTELDVPQHNSWLAPQYTSAGQFLLPAVEGWLRDGQFDYFNKAMQSVLPPRLLLPVALLVLATWSLPFSIAYSAVFAGLFLLNVAAIGVAIPPSMWESASWLLVSKLPALVWHTCRSALLIPAFAKTYWRTLKAKPLAQESE